LLKQTDPIDLEAMKQEDDENDQIRKELTIEEEETGIAKY